MSDLLDRARAWLDHDPDEETRAELAALLQNADAHLADLADRFAGPLEFGTAGLRGILGAGENRMNRAVVRRTTWALGTELLAHHAGAPPLVIIGFDGRKSSDVFARDAALVLTKLGLYVQLYDGVGPTPLLAFTVGLGAAAGIMVTASHNPPEYNGYKVYWNQGAQIVPPIDAQIAARIAQAGPANAIALDDHDAAIASAHLHLVGDALRTRYLDGIKKLSRAGGDRTLTIVYTAMHGVGDALCTAALAQAGFTSVHSVPEQQKPDGAFPTVAFPNPEEKGAMDLSFALGRDKKADLILANDPDADRLAVAIPDAASPTGFRQLTGNEVGVLLGHHVLTRDPPAADPTPRLAIASIVSSPMLGAVAAALGVRYEETLTGFKWIEHRALEVEAQSGAQLAFGYEEALGYTVGTLVRDKDGISAAVVFAELVADLRTEGHTVVDRLTALYRQHGLFVSAQVNMTKRGCRRRRGDRRHDGAAARPAADDDRRAGGARPPRLPGANAHCRRRQPSAAAAAAEQRRRLRARRRQPGHRQAERHRTQDQALRRRASHRR